MSPCYLSLVLLSCAFTPGICSDISAACVKKADYKDVCSDLTLSAVDCTTNFFSSLHSPCSLREPTTTHVTMWQQFAIQFPMNCSIAETKSCMLSLNVQWHRTFRLSLTNHSQDLTRTLTENGNRCELTVNTSLTLYGIENQPDTDSEYSVHLSVPDCMNLSLTAGVFSLIVIEPPCISDIPAPVETYLEYTFTKSVQCPKMNVSFIGGKQDAVTTFRWQNKNGETICFTAGMTRKSGKYICGWTELDRNMCNRTIWLVINNCTSADTGNYSVYATGRGDGQPAHVFLAFQNLNSDEGSPFSAVVSSAATVLLLLLIITTVVIIVVCGIYRNRFHHSLTPTQPHTNNNVQTVLHLCDPSIENDGLTMHIPGQRRIWKSMRRPQEQLVTSNFINIAEKITYWKVLARHLGISEPDIVAIECDYSHNYQEQKVQMLLKWFNQQPSPPTRQTLVRIIEEKMKNPILAKEVDSVLLMLDLEKESTKPRSCTT